MGHYRFLCGREVGEKYFDITIQIYFSKLKRADEKHQVVYLNQKLKKKLLEHIQDFSPPILTRDSPVSNFMR